jgi:hypothetical protein
MEALADHGEEVPRACGLEAVPSWIRIGSTGQVRRTLGLCPNVLATAPQAAPRAQLVGLLDPDRVGRRGLTQPQDHVGLLDQERIVRRAHDGGAEVAREPDEQRTDGERVCLVEP